MASRKKSILKLGQHSDFVEEQNRQRAIDRLAEIPIVSGRRPLVRTRGSRLAAAAFDGAPRSVAELSALLLKKKGKVNKRLLRYSAAAMLVACSHRGKPPPDALVKLVCEALGSAGFTRKSRMPSKDEQAFIQFALAFPNASFRAAKECLGVLMECPEPHTATLQALCRRVGAEVLLKRIEEENHEDYASEVIQRLKKMPGSKSLRKRLRKKEASRYAIRFFLENGHQQAR